MKKWILIIVILLAVMSCGEKNTERTKEEADRKTEIKEGATEKNVGSEKIKEEIKKKLEEISSGKTSDENIFGKSSGVGDYSEEQKSKIKSQIKELKEKLEKDGKNIDNYIALLDFYAKDMPATDTNREMYDRIINYLIEGFPDYPMSYYYMAMSTYNKNPDKWAEYTDRGIEAFENPDSQKYKISEQDSYLCRLYMFKADKYRISGEIQKAIDLYVQKKNIIEKNCSDSFIIKNNLKNDNEKLKSSDLKQYETNKKNLNQNIFEK